MTHAGASAIWLEAPSGAPDAGEGSAPASVRKSLSTAAPWHSLRPDTTLVYRHMGDEEFSHLLAHSQLPASQPYQTIVEGATGRTYCEQYLRGRKWVDTSPTTVVEFRVPRALVARLFAMQHKAEDGVLSHGA